MKMDVLPYSNENLLINFPPVLRRNFEELLRYGKLGLSAITSHDITFNKHYEDDTSSYCYYYTLKIPYAGKKLSWDVIFTPEDMCFAPDFNFNDETFFMSHDINLIIDNIPSLLNWNVQNANSLTSVLTEFVNLYKKQQIDKLQKENIYSQVNTEYQELVEGVISPEDVELCVESTCAHFVINIKLDISSLPEYLHKGEKSDAYLNPGDDNCILKISYLKLDGSKANTSIQLSPRLEQVIGDIKSLQIPAYSKKMSLTEYINSITKLLQSHIKKIEQHHNLKKHYINSLCLIYAENIIECDMETFSKGIFMCEVDDYHCIVHIDIGSNFPQEKPKVSLHSLYCLSTNKPCVQELEDYAYSPRWSPELMLYKLTTHLSEAVPKFKKHNHL